MATIKGKLKTKSGDVMYPETSADKVTGLATVATSGSYSDLSNKPTIPTKLSQLSERAVNQLVWNDADNKGCAGGVSPIGAAMSNEHRPNRLAFFNGDLLTIQFSSDSGSTWTTQNYTKAEKCSFVTKSHNIPICRATSSDSVALANRTRFIFTFQDGNNPSNTVYTAATKILMDVSTAGGLQVDVEYRSGTSYVNNTDSWVKYGTYTLAGWSGWNDIPFRQTIGGGGNQTGNPAWQVRLTFKPTSVNSQYPTTCNVMRMRLYGDTSWNCPSRLASDDRMYAFDMNKNVSFEADVAAVSFTENGTALANKYLGKTAKAADSSKLNGQDASYYLDYNNFTNKPTIPTVNNGTLTIKVAGSSKGTFTANQSTATTIDITASDLGLSAAMKFIGTTTTSLSDGSTTNPITIGSSSVTATAGNVVLYSTKEFVWTGSAWEELGNEGSYALSSVKIEGTGALGGGGTLAANRTITHNEVLGTAQTTAKVFKVKIDKYGHISEATAAGASDVGAATSGHTHTTTIASDTGNSSISLSANSKYKLTAGGTSFVFTTPSDTTYSSKTAASGGTDVSLVTTGEKYTWNAKVSGSSLTSDYFVVGNGNGSVKASSLKPTTSSTTWSDSSDVNVPTMKAIASYVTGKGYTTNSGTVTSVRVQAGTGLSSSTSTAQSSSLNTTISIASGYKLPTTTEWGGKQDALVSGTNIKTINGNSILGSGNITISGGGSSVEMVDLR